MVQCLTWGRTEYGTIEREMLMPTLFKFDSLGKQAGNCISCEETMKNEDLNLKRSNIVNIEKVF